MSKHRVRVVQVYRVEREIVVEVEADDLESAVEEQSAGDAPSFDDPGWKAGWVLENEEVTAA